MDKGILKFRFALVRVPFFLEPDYINRPAEFWESHDTRMIRKFGSKAAFDRVKASHGLIPRGAEVGLNESVGYTEENLSRRRQSSTLNAHRLVYFVAKEFSLGASERLYDELNRRHFTEAGVLNDIDLLLESAELVLGEEGRESCAAFLASARGVQAVLRTVDMVHELGVHSIPTLVVDGGAMVLGGAERAEGVANALRQVVFSGNVTGRQLFGASMQFD